MHAIQQYEEAGVDFRGHIILLTAILATLVFSSDAQAYLPGYSTRAIPSTNDKYLLVLLAPNDGSEVTDEPSTEDEARWQEMARQIEACYSQSGLYLNDESTKIFWPIDYIYFRVKENLCIG